MSVVTEVLQQLQGLVGLVLITLGAWALSEDRRARPGLRWILGALLLQVAIALVVVRIPFVWSVIGLANHAVAAVEKATLVGSSYMFGYTGGAPAPFVLPWRPCSGDGGSCRGSSPAFRGRCAGPSGSAGWWA